MKILQIEHYSEPGGGVYENLKNVSIGLKQRGHDIIVAFGTFPDNGLPGFARTLYIPHLTEFSFNGNDGVIRKVTELVRQESPDVIVVHLCANDAVIKTLSKLKPTIQFVHNHVHYCSSGSKLWKFPNYKLCPLQQPNLKCILNHYFRRCGSVRGMIPLKNYARTQRLKDALKMVDRIIVVTEFMRRNLEAAGISKQKTETIPPIINECHCKISDHRMSSNLILYVGSISSNKGLPYLVRALLHVTTPFELVVAGEGYLKENVEQLCKRLGLTDKVHFLGFQKRSSLCKLYRDCSVMVVPSVYPEPFGMVGIEAMRHGRPVIAFNVGGIPEWLEHEQNGYLIQPFNITELGERINILLSDKEKALKMGKRGCQLYEERFTQTTLLDRLMAIYADVAGVGL